MVDPESEPAINEALQEPVTPEGLWVVEGVVSKEAFLAAPRINKTLLAGWLS